MQWTGAFMSESILYLPHEIWIRMKDNDILPARIAHLVKCRWCLDLKVDVLTVEGPQLVWLWWHIHLRSRIACVDFNPFLIR